MEAKLTLRLTFSFDQNRCTFNNLYCVAIEEADFESWSDNKRCSKEMDASFILINAEYSSKVTRHMNLDMKIPPMEIV